MTQTQVVEVYTATWCINCVDTEHALMDALEGEDATVMVHHRFIENLKIHLALKQEMIVGLRYMVQQVKQIPLPSMSSAPPLPWFLMAIDLSQEVRRMVIHLNQIMPGCLQTSMITDHGMV